MPPALTALHPPFARLAGRSLLWRFWLVVRGAALLAASAQVAIPMVPVPMTLQSMVVVALAILAGRRLAAEITGTYLVAGLAGAPVFSGARGGLAVLYGPSGGYLVGFFAAAFVVGWLSELPEERRLRQILGLMILGHVILLSFGVGWLAHGIGLGPAFEKGLYPFLPGGAAKVVLGTVLVALVERAVPAPRH